MKTFLLSVVAAVAGMIFFSGCGKSSETPPGTPPPQVINATEFRPAFASASPDIKAVVDQVMMDIQMAMMPDALKELAKLSAKPALTETQKKVVSDLTEQLKRKLAAQSEPPK